MGASWGAPVICGVNWAFARSIVAIWGISLAMTACCAWGVPGTDAFTFSFGLSSGIAAKSGGRSAPATYSHGPDRYTPRNQRPATRTYVFWSFRYRNTLPVVFFT